MRKLILILAAMAATLTAQDQRGQAAQKPMESWLALIDAGSYGDSWDQAAGIFQKQVTKAQWQDAVKGVRGQTGKLKSRALKTSQYTESLPNAPPGKYVVSQYDSTFDAGPCVETVLATEEKQGDWKVAGYFVKPRR